MSEWSKHYDRGVYQTCIQCVQISDCSYFIIFHRTFPQDSSNNKTVACSDIFEGEGCMDLWFRT